MVTKRATQTCPSTPPLPSRSATSGSGRDTLCFCVNPHILAQHLAVWPVLASCSHISIFDNDVLVNILLSSEVHTIPLQDCCRLNI